MTTTRHTSLVAAHFELQALPHGWTAFVNHLCVTLRASTRPAATARHSLDKGATTWIGCPRGRELVCEAGTLWLTFDGEPRDMILEAGESHRCMKASRLSVHALAAAHWRLDTPRSR